MAGRRGLAGRLVLVGLILAAGAGASGRAAREAGGRAIAISRHQDGPPHDYEIHLISTSGHASEKSLTHAPGGNLPAFDSEPAWSPNGKQIAFTSERGNTERIHELWVMNADGSNAHRLSHAAGVDVSRPSWSPDGTQIAYEALFFHNEKSTPQIFVIAADDKGRPERPRPTTFAQRAPSWSPKGDEIAFVQCTQVGSQECSIFAMDAGGGTQRRLTAAGSQDSFPAWSPDGKRIAFSGNPDGRTEIYVINADGSGRHRLTNTVIDARDEYPTWSPDSRQIAFTRTGYEHADDRVTSSAIYIVSAFGGPAKRITSDEEHAGDALYPAWKP